MGNFLKECLKEKGLVLAVNTENKWPVVIKAAEIAEICDYVEICEENKYFTIDMLKSIVHICGTHGLPCIMKARRSNAEDAVRMAMTLGFRGILFVEESDCTGLEDMFENIDGSIQCIGVLIEDITMVKNFEKVCQIPKIDFIQLGKQKNVGDKIKEKKIRAKYAEREAIEIASRYQVDLRMLLGSVEEAEKYITMGIHHFVI